MKKIIFGSICILLLASCNTDVKNSEEYKRLQAQNDSLLRANQGSEAEAADLQALINEVEENFNQIKAAEKYLTVESKKSGELSADSRAQIQENFKVMQDILKKNKDKIAALNKMAANSKSENSALKATIERLNKEMESSVNTISELQVALAARDQEIAKLSSDVKELKTMTADLASTNADQANKIKKQDKSLNTAYYIFGTSKELKDAQILKGGFLVSSKLTKETYDKDKFISIDIRDVKEIPVYAKKAKVLSQHPSNSYSLVKDGNGNIIVKITDYQAFWSVTPFLVIEVG